MANLISKTGEQIRDWMYFWFLKYHGKTVDEFDGTELFTLFDKISPDEKKLYLEKLNLPPEELAVFILRVDSHEVIINTTRKFVRLTNGESESIVYGEFEWHSGFKTIVATRNESNRRASIKTNGYASEFGIEKKDGQIVYWDIPTGYPGFAFWNVTKRFGLIGRKYI
jgi:hypothetical protein